MTWLWPTVALFAGLVTWRVIHNLPRSVGRWLDSLPQD